MKFRKRTIPIFMTILLLAPALAYASERVYFSGTEFFDPFGILGAPVGQYLPSGATVDCPGHVPTGDPLHPCPKGSRTHVRNSKWQSRYVSSTPGFSSGWMTVLANANLDPNFEGPQWGTYILEFDTGGRLLGTWHAVRSSEGDHWISPLSATGHVIGGPLDGANVKLSDMITSFTPIPIAYVGVVGGTVHVNGNGALTEFIATEVLDPFGIQGNGPVGEFLDFGALRCPGSPGPWSPFTGCPAGSSMLWMGLKWRAAFDSPDPRLNGDRRIEANLIWNAAGEGSTTSRFSLDVDAGGTWAGDCHGSRMAIVDHFLETLHCTARGSGGIVNGLEATFTLSIPQYPSPAINYVGYVEGTVIEPSAN